MKKSILIHNPKCSKSRGAKELLEESKIEFIVIDYLKDGLTADLLKDLPKLLNLSYSEMVRQKEATYIELGLKNRSLDQQEWVECLMAHPILLERPIFIHGDKAIIARPQELVLELL